MRRLLMTAMLLAIGSAGAAQNVFKCVGDDGKVTYQDHPCDSIAAAQCHAYAARPIASSQGGIAMNHYTALFALIDKELAQKRAAADAEAAAQVASAASDGQDRRKLCDNNKNDADPASLKDPSATADCDEAVVSGHTAQASAGAIMVAPGRH